MEAGTHLCRLGTDGDREIGGLIVAGSYVPKTTAQLAHLRETCPVHTIEMDVRALLDPTRAEAAIARAATDMNATLRSGHDTLVFTSRELVTDPDPTASLALGDTVSRALTTLVRSLTVRPRYLIAKGGITSSDLATRALGVNRAMIRGQLLPGVPVWRLGPESRFPDLDYVVFPGNVGATDALSQAVTAARGCSGAASAPSARNAHCYV